MASPADNALQYIEPPPESEATGPAQMPPFPSGSNKSKANDNGLMAVPPPVVSPASPPVASPATPPAPAEPTQPASPMATVPTNFGPGRAVDLAVQIASLSKQNPDLVNQMLRVGGVSGIDVRDGRWCAALVNSALAQAGIKGTGNELASSFRTYGQPIDAGQAQKGDIFVAAPSEGATGHAGLLTGQKRWGPNGLQLQVVSSHLQGDPSNPGGVEWRDAAGLTLRRATAAGSAAAMASGSEPPPNDDPAFQRYQTETRSAIDHLSGQIDRLMAAAEKATPGSVEREQLLQQAIDHSRHLSDRYEKLSEAPPKPQSPFEAAGTYTPLLIGLISLAGLRSRQPFLASMTALGSALGALKQGNDENYKNAIDLWTKQTEMASKAFTMQNQTIDSIIKDITLNDQERQLRLQNAFRVLGLEKDLALAKSNMWKDVYERQDARVKLADDHEYKRAEIARALAEAHRAEAQAATDGVPGAVGAEYSNMIQAWSVAHPKPDGSLGEPDPQTKADLLEQAHKKVGGSSNARGEEAYVQAYLAAHPDKDPDQARLEAHNAYVGTGARARQEATPLGKAIAAEETKISQAKIARGEPGDLTPQEHLDAQNQAKAMELRLKQSINVGVTGNKRIEVQNELYSYGEALNNINDIFRLMRDYGMVAGVGGRALRAKETITDILGSDESGRNDFKRRIEELQLWAVGLLKQRAQGRQLSADENKILDIVPGLSMFQPTAQVNSQLLHLRQIFSDLYRLRQDQLEGKFQMPTNVPLSPDAGIRGTVAAPSAAAATPAPTGTDDYSYFAPVR